MNDILLYYTDTTSNVLTVTAVTILFVLTCKQGPVPWFRARLSARTYQLTGRGPIYRPLPNKIPISIPECYSTITMEMVGYFSNRNRN